MMAYNSDRKFIHGG
jgi:coiled-coil and C2 domain-containing protein 2A